MLNRETLDAVIVCTPPVTHPELCTKVMQAGLHVLCEKPLAIDSSSARQMLEQAKACEVKFTMASKFRYVDDVLRAKSIVTSGILGEIVLVRKHLRRPCRYVHAVEFESGNQRRWSADR